MRCVFFWSPKLRPGLQNGMPEADKLIEKLMDTQKRMESLSTSEYEDLNFEVHTGIWTAADNMRLYKMLSNLWNGPSIGFTSEARSLHQIHPGTY